MNTEWLFEDAHQMFRESVKRWVAAELAPHADQWGEKGEFPFELYRKAGNLGFFAGAMPEAYGGVGGDFRYHVVFSEELAYARSYGVSAGLGLHGFVAVPTVAAFGSEEIKKRYLAPGIRGELVGALGVTEPEPRRGLQLTVCSPALNPPTIAPLCFQSPPSTLYRAPASTAPLGAKATWSEPVSWE